MVKLKHIILVTYLDKIHIIREAFKLPNLGTKYNNHKESHTDEHYLNLEDIEHTKTKAYRFQTNGICEQFHKTRKTECYGILFRRKIYIELIEIWEILL